MTMIDINILPLLIPNFKTKGMMTHMAKMADVILVGNNNSIGVCCDGLICAEIK